MSHHHHHYNSFLPTGGADYPPNNIPSSRSSSSSIAISPLSQPRRTYMSPPRINNHPAQGKPLSPPQSRSPSAENASAALLEDWRTYTANLRTQYQGERAHLMADRARMEECMEEERQLWELERSYFVAQVAELEAKLDEMRRRARSLERRAQGLTPQPASASSSSSGTVFKPSSNNAFGSRSRSASRRDSSSPKNVPQESGRDADGSPFYAPAPRNPSRTFGSTEASNLRIDSITTASEGMIQVSNKGLKASDFNRNPGKENPQPVLDAPAGIDISFIEPELEGVSLKASAVYPNLAARVRSPVSFPDQAAAAARPEASLVETTNRQPSPRRSPTNAGDRATQAMEVANAPENKRLTMNAGHTPSHSISKIPWLEEDGDATPRQHIIHKGAIDRRASLALSLASVPDDDEEDDEDKELTGPLGLTNEPVTDNPFLTALTEKLEEVQRSLPTSPSDSDESTSTLNGKREEEEENDEGPRLKIKPSLNFGRPMGSM